jgi:hypothetical protein
MYLGALFQSTKNTVGSMLLPLNLVDYVVHFFPRFSRFFLGSFFPTRIEKVGVGRVFGFFLGSSQTGNLRSGHLAN